MAGRLEGVPKKTPSPSKVALYSSKKKKKDKDQLYSYMLLTKQSFHQFINKPSRPYRPKKKKKIPSLSSPPCAHARSSLRRQGPWCSHEVFSREECPPTPLSRARARNRSGRDGSRDARRRRQINLWRNGEGGRRNSGRCNSCSRHAQVSHEHLTFYSCPAITSSLYGTPFSILGPGISRRPQWPSKFVLRIFRMSLDLWRVCLCDDSP